MATVVLKLFIGQGTGQTDGQTGGQSGDYMLPPLGSIISIQWCRFWCITFKNISCSL